MAMYSINGLKQYVDKIFGAFEKSGCSVGQGGYFTRNWYNDSTMTQGFKLHLQDVLEVLLQNEHIVADDAKSGLPFLKLTQSGYDYIQGGDLSISKISLSKLIDVEESKEQIYNHLWAFIGKDNEAPFYLNGPDFFKTIAPYVGLASYTYSQYMDKCANDRKSTSRTVWYREMFNKVQNKSIENFLDAISHTIVEIYSPLLCATVDGGMDTLQGLDSLPLTTSSDKRIVVFISYTWETKVTIGHKDWVKKLADRLKEENFKMLFDQYQPLGTEMNQFMADAVHKADKILLICTPTFKQRSDDMQNACGFEASMISNELIKDIKGTKFIPIVRIGEPKDVIPTYLGNRNALIWYKEDDDKEKIEILLKDLKGV